MFYVNCDENENSFEDLYSKYYDLIYNYIFHSILNKEITEDLTSSTFYKALDNLTKKNPRINNFHAWIFKIATNEIIKYKSNSKLKENISLDDNINQLEKFLDDKNKNIPEYYDDFIILQSELDKISQTEQKLIILHYFEKKTYSEIAQILNIKENTLRPMMSRTLKKLYNKMKNKLKNAPFFN